MKSKILTINRNLGQIICFDSKLSASMGNYLIVPATLREFLRKYQTQCPLRGEIDGFTLLYIKHLKINVNICKHLRKIISKFNKSKFEPINLMNVLHSDPLENYKHGR